MFHLEMTLIWPWSDGPWKHNPNRYHQNMNAGITGVFTVYTLQQCHLIPFELSERAGAHVYESSPQQG